MSAIDRNSSNLTQGFSLVELLVTLVISMVILAGLYSNFILQSRVQSSQSTSVDALEDLRLASHIMAGQLRLAANICTDPTNGLVYQPLGAITPMTSSCSGALPQDWGAFSFSSSPPSVMWKQPGTNAPVQLLKGLDSTNGFLFTPTGVGNALRTVTLTSLYQGIDQQNRTVQIKFNVLPRNY